MALFLQPNQIQKAHSAKPMQVALVKLTTYSDYAAETVASTYYWGSVPLLYRWDGVTVNQFQGFLRGVSDITHTMPHLPDDEQLATLTNLRLELSNEDWGTESLWKVLDAENLVAARVEVASLLLDWSTATDSSWIDQSTTTADHIVRWRGEVDGMPEFDSEATSFVIECVTKEKPLPWPRALKTTEVSRKHLGKLYPVPVGRPKRVPLIQRQVGWFTTVSTDLTETTTGTVQVTDTAGLPAAGNFGIWIGTERITASVVSDTSISIVTRGTTVDGLATTARIHNAGSVLIEEIDVARFVFSGVPILGFEKLYARSPHTGELVFIPKGLYGFATQDEALDTGEKLGVVTFTQKLWGQLIQLLNNEEKVTIQPTFVESSMLRTEVAARITTAVPTSANTGSGSQTDASIAGTVGTADFAGVGFPYISSEAVFYYWLDTDLTSVTDVVLRYRLRIEYTITSDSSVHTPLQIYAGNGFLGATTLHTYNLPAGSPDTTRSLVLGWVSCPGGTTVDDMSNGVSFSPSSPTIAMFWPFLFGVNTGPHTGETRMDRLNVSVEMELAGGGISQVVATATSGAQEIGFNLDLFADVLGAVNLGTETALTNFDTIAQTTNSWAGTNCSLTDITAAGLGITSVGSGTATVRTLALLNQSPAINFNGARIRFEYNVSSGTWDAMTGDRDAFEFLLLSSAGNSVRWEWPKSVLHGDGAWHEFTLEIYGSSPQVQESLGTINAANVIQINIDWETTSSGNTGAFSIRNLRSEARTFPEHPIDVAEWLIEDELGEAVNAASFTTAKTNLPSVTISGDLRDAGGTFSEVLGRIGFESRTNFIVEERWPSASTSVYKAMNALSTYAFPASGASLVVGDYGALKVSTKQIGERPTEFTAIFDRHHDYALSDLLAYRDLLQANTTTNDLASDGVLTATLTTQQDLVGVRPSGVEVFTLIGDSTSAIEVWAYYVAEALRGTAKRFSMELPYRHSYALELGDILTLTPTYTTSTVKVRVTALAFSFTEPTILVSAEEVL